MKERKTRMLTKFDIFTDINMALYQTWAHQIKIHFVAFLPEIFVSFRFFIFFVFIFIPFFLSFPSRFFLPFFFYHPNSFHICLLTNRLSFFFSVCFLPFLIDIAFSRFSFFLISLFQFNLSLSFTHFLLASSFPSFLLLTKLLCFLGYFFYLILFPGSPPIYFWVGLSKFLSHLIGFSWHLNLKRCPRQFLLWPFGIFFNQYLFQIWGNQ